MVSEAYKEDMCNHVVLLQAAAPSNGTCPLWQPCAMDVLLWTLVAMDYYI